MEINFKEWFFLEDNYLLIPDQDGANDYFGNLDYLPSIKMASGWRTNKIKEIDKIIEFIDPNKSDISNIELKSNGYGYESSWEHKNQEYYVYFDKIHVFEIPANSLGSPKNIEANGYIVDFVGPRGFQPTDSSGEDSLVIYKQMILIIRKLLEMQSVDFLRFAGMTDKMDRIYDKFVKSFASNKFTWYNNKILLNNSFLDRILLLYPKNSKNIMDKLSDTKKSREERLSSIKKQEDDKRILKRKNMIKNPSTPSNPSTIVDVPSVSTNRKLPSFRYLPAIKTADT